MAGLVRSIAFLLGIAIGLPLGHLLFFATPDAGITGFAVAEPSTPELTVAEGYALDTVAALEGPRAIALGPSGTLYVATEEGVYALVDRDGDRRIDRRYRVADVDATGLAFSGRDLLLAGEGRLLSLPGIEHTLTRPPEPVVLADGLPQLGPATTDEEGMLYVAVPAQCDSCKPEQPRGTILRVDPAGESGEYEIYASGVKRPGGLLWYEGALWFTDDGRDVLDIPDELNRATRKGQHFGFPYCAAGQPNPRQNKGLGCNSFEAPVHVFAPDLWAAGLAPLDLSGLEGWFAIADAGLWNMEGYTVRAVTVDGNERTLVSGWLAEEGAWGSPVALATLTDGSLLIVDELGGTLFRLRKS